jgi:hypothetical protein
LKKNIKIKLKLIDKGKRRRSSTRYGGKRSVAFEKIGNEVFFTGRRCGG